MKAAGMLVSRLRMVCLIVLTMAALAPWVTPDHLKVDTWGIVEYKSAKRDLQDATQPPAEAYEDNCIHILTG
jgi:hypothetical protein